MSRMVDFGSWKYTPLNVYIWIQFAAECSKLHHGLYFKWNHLICGFVAVVFVVCQSFSRERRIAYISSEICLKRQCSVSASHLSQCYSQFTGCPTFSYLSSFFRTFCDAFYAFTRLGCVNVLMCVTFWRHFHLDSFFFALWCARLFIFNFSFLFSNEFGRFGKLKKSTEEWWVFGWSLVLLLLLLLFWYCLYESVLHVYPVLMSLPEASVQAHNGASKARTLLKRLQMVNNQPKMPKEMNEEGFRVW